VSNDGQAAAAGSWDDQVILSHDGVLGNSDDIVLGTVRRGTSLAAGASYAQSGSFTLPVHLEGGYSIFVKTDSSAEVNEPDTRANNASAAQPISLTTSYSDLSVEAVGYRRTRRVATAST